MSLRAGLIGVGNMGKNHLRVLRNLNGVDLVGIYDTNTKLSLADSNVGISNEFKDFLDLNLDYAVVAVPTIYHEEFALLLAEEGIHAFIEKPISHDLTSAIRIRDVFKSENLIGAVGHIERFNPAVIEAKKRLSEVGNIYQILTRREGPFPGRISDVGVIRDLASHDIDITEWISNQSFVTIYAQTAFKSGRPNEDLMIAMATLDKGAKSNHIVNWLSPKKSRSIVILGENGTFEIDTLNADLTFFKNGTIKNMWDEISYFRGVSEGDSVRYAIEKKEPLVREHENFRDAILGKSNEIVTFDEGVRVLEVAEAISKSAKDNIVVSI